MDQVALTDDAVGGEDEDVHSTDLPHLTELPKVECLEPKWLALPPILVVEDSQCDWHQVCTPFIGVYSPLALGVPLR